MAYKNKEIINALNMIDNGLLVDFEKTTHTQTVSVISVKGDVDPAIQGFYEFNLVINNIYNKIKKDIVNDDAKRDKNLKQLPRMYRRQVEKVMPSKNYTPKLLNEADEVSSFCQKIIKIIEDEDSFLNSNEDFARLIVFDMKYKNDDMFGLSDDLIVNRFHKIKKSNDVIKYFVNNSLNNVDQKCDFLKCFDEDGNIKIDSVYLLRSILYEQYRKIVSNYSDYKDIDMDEFVNSLITDELLKKADLYKFQKNEEKRLEEERIKEEKRLEKERLERLKKEVQNVNKAVKNTYNEQDVLYKEVINPSTYSLRKNIDELFSLEELENKLEKIKRIPKEDKIKFIEEYQRRKKDRKLNYILNIVPKNDLKKLKHILKNEQDNKEIMDLINNQLLSDEFEEYSDEQIKEMISNILNNNYLKETNILQNYIIFIAPELISEETNRVLNSETTDSKSSIIKSIQNHLLTLQNHNLNEIKSNKSDAFHELMTTHRNLFIIDKLKGYRYGARKTKIGVFVLSVNQENQTKLQEIYKTDINANAILVFGMGSVVSEKECDLMTRIKKYGFDNEDKIMHINKIFSEPFTSETLKEACCLINDGLLAIQNMKGFDDPTNVNKCPILK